MDSVVAVNENEVYEFRVRNMAGDASMYSVVSIEELRVRLAILAGVLCPCIVLFKSMDNPVLEDGDEVAQVFRGSMQPYELLSINNEESVKKEVTGWSVEKWIDVMETHQRYEDENTVDRAMPLKLADQNFEGKTREWIRGIINKTESHQFLDEVAGGIKAAVALGVKPEAVSCYPYAYTLLHKAVELDHMAVLRTLVAAEGGNVDAEDHWGNTPLYWAALHGRPQAAALLLEKEAEVNKPNFYWRTPIFDAARYGHPDVVALLIEAGANVNAADRDGRTPLHQASRSGQVEIIHLLVQNGANVNIEDLDEETPFDFACNEETKQALRGQ